MSRLNIQDDFDEPWDDFTPTQLERVESHAAVNKGDLNDETMIDNENVFPFNSSKAAFDIFLDDLICSPIKSKIKKAPLGDITNKHQQKLSTKDKKTHKTHIPALTRMDSLDDSIWTEFDTDLLSLIESNCDPLSNDSTKIEPSIDETFRLKHQSKEKSLPSFITAKGSDLPPPSKETTLKYAKLFETDDSSLPPVSINEALFLPPVSKADDLSLEQSKNNDKCSPTHIDNHAPPKSKDVPAKLQDDKGDIPSYDDLFFPPASSYNILPSPSTSNFLSQSSKDDSDSSLPSYDDLFLPPMYKYKILPYNPLPSSKSLATANKDDLLPFKDENVSQVTDDDLSIKSSPVEFKYPSFIGKRKFDIPNTIERKNSFVTANGTSLNPVSENSKQQVRNMFSDEKTSELTTAVSPNEKSSFQDAKKYDNVMNQFGGFQTGNGKKSFDISSQAKRKAISVLDEQENKKTRLNIVQLESPTTSSEMSKFTNEISLSKKAAFKEQYDNNINQFGGFQTGNSKRMFDISSQAKRKAISVLDEQENVQFDEKASKFTTASGASIKAPSERGIQSANSLIKDPKQYDSDMNQFGGFQTGNGKKNFDISSQAKRKAISVLDKVEQEYIEEEPKLTTASGASIEISSDEKGIQSTTSLFKDSKQYDSNINQFGGFQTGNRKKSFEISSQAKRQAISVLDKQESTPLTSNVPVTTPQMEKPKFTTASGASIKAPSEKGKQKATSLFQDAKKYDNDMNQFGGFQTGNGKKNFDISSQAKRTAISVLDEQKNKPLPPKKDLSDILESPIDMFSKEYTQKTFANPVLSTKKVPELPNMTKPESSAPIFPKRNTSRPSVIKRQNKPFKSPIIQSNLELTKAAVSSRAISKSKLTPVFELKAPADRYKLSFLGKPGQFSKSQLVAKNIPIVVIHMTAYTAKRYFFDMKWGPKEAQNDLIQAGAVPRRVSFEWVENHYGWIVWKLACMIRSYPDHLDHWKSQYVLDQLLYRYEREINMGHRPVLRRILEKDDLPIKHMILMISDIVEIKSALQYNTSSKYRLQLSDGWYQVPTCIDLRMERAIMKKKLKIGSKLSICGASMIGDKEGIHPLENIDNSTLLSITTNSSLPAHWDTKLGYHPRKLITRSIQTIFYDGGTVTALDIIVCRKFPILYSEVLPNGSIITRNAKEEEEARRAALGYDGYGVRQSKLENERRVSGYFKLRICDARSSSDQQLATLMLSNASELNHMDISEGNRYKIFFVIPYHPKNKKYPGLDLKTTRITRWEPAPAVNLKNVYIPRFLSICSDIRQKDPSSDFDLVVLVLQTGPATLENLNNRKLWHQTLLVTDESLSICQIDFRLPMNPFSDIKGQVFGLMNLRFEMYDAKFDITLLKATDESESITKFSSASEYIQKGIHKLKKWVSDNPNQVQSVTDRIHNLVQ